MFDIFALKKRKKKSNIKKAGNLASFDQLFKKTDWSLQFWFKLRVKK